MRCSELQNIFDDYLDGKTAAKVSLDLERHVLDCDACQTQLEQHRDIRSRLSQLPMEGPSEDFFDRAFDGVDELALQENDRTRPNQRPGQGRGTIGSASWVSRGRGAAIAAVFVIAIATAVMWQQPFSNTPSSGIPEVSIAMHEVTPVTLVFSAEDALQDARLSLQLPDGIELAGDSGRSALSWKTDLEPGKNVLRLPFVGHVASAGEVVATLEHAKGTKTFRLKVKVI